MKISITKTKFVVDVNGELVSRELNGVISEKTIMSKLYSEKVFGEIKDIKTVYEHYVIPEEVLKEYYVDEVDGKKREG